MAEYIEKDKAINTVFEAFADGRSAYIALETIPAADVVPVRHGRWIKEIFNDGYGDYPLYVCSECRAQSARKRNFCYDCGAKMDGEA